MREIYNNVQFPASNGSLCPSYISTTVCPDCHCLGQDYCQNSAYQSLSTMMVPSRSHWSGPPSSQRAARRQAGSRRRTALDASKSCGCQHKHIKTMMVHTIQSDSNLQLTAVFWDSWYEVEQTTVDARRIISSRPSQAWTGEVLHVCSERQTKFHGPETDMSDMRDRRYCHEHMHTNH